MFVFFIHLTFYEGARGTEKRMDMIKLTAYMLVTGGLLFSVGCSTTKKETAEKIFYPPPPAQPRLQYLTSFSEERDLVPPMNAIKKFILGEDDESTFAIVKPYGMALQGTKLYVCDTVIGQVHILDLEARTWEMFTPKGMGKLRKPINISVDSDGVRYVADSLLGEILIYSADGTFMDAIGQDGSMKPVGIAVSDDRIYIGDLEQRKVHVYDKARRQRLFSIPRNPENTPEQLFAPTNLTIDQSGNVYVSDTGAFRVQQYDPEGNYVKTYGGPGQSSGQFMRNKGVAVDHNSIIYVSDAASQTIQMFDSEGQLLLYFGEPGGSSVPLVLPAGVAIDYNNVELFQPYADENFKLEYLLFVANQYGPRKIAVYGFGSMMQP